MEILGIDPELSDRSKKGLVWCYKKYKAFNAAVQTMDQLSKRGQWPLPKKPSHTELVEIFLSKSYWHSHVVKHFAFVARYPQMVAWLERDGDSPSDFDVWHLQKSEYGFKELKEWLANEGTLDKVAMRKLEKAKGQAKGQAKGKGKIVKGKGKEKDHQKERMEVDGDSDGRGEGSSSKKTHKRK
ncbi:hypothetical protein BYT27DRAFT_7107556 [Phlegmacium glaucopus]|nr:hypothetical protein BYT27DRAFT_7107556 [Phlegmacium glaucopus]